MVVVKQGEYWYSDGPDEIPAVLTESSKGLTQHFKFPVCECGGRLFLLHLDEACGVAIRQCVECESEHVMGWVDEHLLKEAEPDVCDCLCGESVFEICGAVSPYDDNPNDARWFSIGCRCVNCGCTGYYGGWPCRWRDYKDWLARV